MKRCLSEPALLAVATGDGLAWQLGHAATCSACAKRLTALKADLELLAGTLTRPAPAIQAQPRGRRLRARLIPVAAAAGLAFLAGAWSAARLLKRAAAVSLAGAPAQAWNDDPLTSFAGAPADLLAASDGEDPAAAAYIAYSDDGPD